MRYYRIAVLLNWLAVGGLLSALAVLRGAYPAIPFYLVFVMIGGTVPALICAWVLRAIGRVTRVNSLPLWMFRGAYLGMAYVLMSNFMMQSVIGHVSLDSIKGFLCFVFFGPVIFMGIGKCGALLIGIVGAVNGAALYRVDSQDKSP